LRNSSTSRDASSKGHGLLRSLLAGLAAVCLSYPACAVDPNRLISQYIHDYWGSEKGFNGGSITAIAQTTDGYLWIGTERGLIRFDGLNFRLFQQASPTTFPIGPVQGLVADPQGSLWIVLQSTKILRYHDGRFELGREEAEVGITSVSRGREGTVLFSSLALGPLTYHDGKFEPLTAPAERANSAPSTAGNDDLSSHLSWATGVATHRFAEPNSAVISMAETSDGKIWLGTHDKGLFYLKNGQISRAEKGMEQKKINCLLPLENGELWVGTDEGVVRWNGAEITRVDVPSALGNIQVLSLARDRDANIWVGSSRGLLRINKDGVSSMEEAALPAGTAVTAIYEDREGNLWIGTTRGVERFRDSAFMTYRVAEGLPSESNGPVYVDEQARTWFAPLDGGFDWLSGGRIGTIRDAGLAKDVVYSVTGNKSGIWIGRQQGGLTHLRYDPHSGPEPRLMAAETYTEAQGLAQNHVYALHIGADDAVWAGTLSGGVSEFKNGKFKTYTAADGLASNTVNSIAGGADGTIWFATPRGLSSLAQGRWRTYTSRDGLPADDVNCLLEDSEGVLWVGTAGGLAFVRSGRVEAPHEIPSSMREQTLGMAADRNGWLWIATGNHVIRVARDKVLGGTLGEADVREYGLTDGLNGTEGVKRQQSVFADPQGRIWFSTNRGLSVVDTIRATRSSAPALVHVDSLSVDGAPVELRAPIRIPPVRQRITLSYAGLSLSVPERVRYRYQLTGFDREWSDAGSTREAVYTNLGPGDYHFRVMASNSEGVWNEGAAALDFTILPAFYQANWFFLLCLSVIGGLAWLIYEWRVRLVAARLDLQFDERLSERSRIARELHDTLLQSFQGLTLHFQRARNLLPDRAEEAIQTLDRALDGAEQAIVEGREAILDIRSPSLAVNDLSEEITALGEELTAHDGKLEPVSFRVLIEGTAQPLHPLLQVEIFRIAREALRNTFSHAQATRVEAEITYTKKLFRLRIRDDGKGIDEGVALQGERAGHWGLPGMRERAKRIGGQLDLWSEPGAGTEVELTIPGWIAYRSSPSRAALQSIRKKHKQTSS
jgi:ligand-binding sensor domain-containing protein/signal transduction histidine kinase